MTTLIEMNPSLVRRLIRIASSIRRRRPPHPLSQSQSEITALLYQPPLAVGDIHPVVVVSFTPPLTHTSYCSALFYPIDLS